MSYITLQSDFFNSNAIKDFWNRVIEEGFKDIDLEFNTETATIIVHIRDTDNLIT